MLFFCSGRLAGEVPVPPVREWALVPSMAGIFFVVGSGAETMVPSMDPLFCVGVGLGLV